MKKYFVQFWEFMKTDGNWKLVLLGFLASLGGQGFWGALWVAVVAACCLEYKDKSYGSMWSWTDWSLVASGGLIGALILLIL
jgi:hypothetical protein